MTAPYARAEKTQVRKPETVGPRLWFGLSLALCANPWPLSYAVCLHPHSCHSSILGTVPITGSSAPSPCFPSHFPCKGRTASSLEYGDETRVTVVRQTVQSVSVLSLHLVNVWYLILTFPHAEGRRQKPNLSTRKFGLGHYSLWFVCLG